MFTLPKLPYKYSALEPVIDEKTMKFHHDVHHQKYVDTLNEDIAKVPELQDKNLIQILTELYIVPEDMRQCVRFNAGGHINHSIYWQTMCEGGEDLDPECALAKLITSTYGSLDELKEEYLEHAGKLYGVGWVWMYVGEGGRLKCDCYYNQDNPYMEGCVPLLGVDCWEHSYYLNYGADREKYINKWWNIVNWYKVADVYDGINVDLITPSTMPPMMSNVSAY